MKGVLQYREAAYGLADGGCRLAPDQLVKFPIGSQAQDGQGRVRHLLMLGGSLLQLPAIRMAREEGWQVILADGNAAALARPWAHHFEHVDLKDLDGLLAMARRYHETGRLHAVFTAATDFSASVAWVSQALGLPGIPYQAALNASSKLRMRRIFHDQAIPSPDFVEIAGDHLPDLKMVQRLQLPVVVKPIDNMGARGVRRLDNWDDLIPALADARGFSRQGTVIVEEFIQGPEYSIDSLVMQGRLIPCGLAVRHVRFPPHFVEVGHTLPSDLSEPQTNELLAVFAKAVNALGITQGAAKGDVFFTPQGPVIGEIAARLSGGYMSGWTFPLASGLEVTRAALYLAMGLALPDLAPVLRRVSAERAIIAIPGTVADIEGQAEVAGINGLEAIFLRTRPGEHTVFPRNNVEKAGNVIAVDIDRTIACQTAESGVAAMFLRMVVDQVETDKFLFHPAEGQPSAYPVLSETLRDRDSWMTAAFSSTALPKLDSNPHQVADLRPFLTPECLREQDWSWRSLADSLDWLEAKRLIQFQPGLPGPADLAFWTALARGGLSGAVYILETWSSLPETRFQAWLKVNIGKPPS